MDYNTRLELEEKLRKRLICLNNIGNTTASKCAAEAVNFIHEIVQQYGGDEDTDTPVDEDGIKWMKRPEGVPSEYYYVYWEEDVDGIKFGWFNTKRPTHVGRDNYTRSGLENDNESPITLHTNDLSFLPTEGGVPEKQIRRLYD